MKRNRTDSAQQSIPPFDGGAAKRAVIKVGCGRGFVMESKHRVPSNQRESMRLTGFRLRAFMRRRIIVTAAHCLPKLPPAHPFSHAQDTTYNLLGPLNEPKPSVMAQCVFVDPVTDVAIFVEPDAQTFEDADIAFDALLDSATVLRMGAIAEETRGWLLSLKGHWTPCRLKIMRGVYASTLWIEEASDGIVGGMSGSPILLDDASVVGVVSTSAGDPNKIHTEGGPQPWLSHCLPAGLLRALQRKRRAR